MSCSFFDRVVGDTVEATGDGRDMYCCVERGEGEGGGGQRKLPCSLQAKDQLQPERFLAGFTRACHGPVV